MGGLNAENLLVGRVHDDGNLLRGTTSRGKQFCARQVDRNDRIRKPNTPLFKKLEETNAFDFFRKIENGHHQFWHRVVKVEDDLGSEHLGYQARNNEEIRHIVNVD